MVVPTRPKACLRVRRTRAQVRRRAPPAPRSLRCPQRRARSLPRHAAKPMAMRSSARHVRTMRRVARRGGRSVRLRSPRTSRARRPAWHRGPSGCGALTTPAAVMRMQRATRTASVGCPVMRRPRVDLARAARVARARATRARVRRRAVVARRRAVAAVRPRAEAARPYSGPLRWTAIQRLTSRLSARRSRKWKTSALGRSALRIESGGFQVCAK